MPYCPNCGIEQRGSDSFCSECGEPLDNSATEIEDQPSDETTAKCTKCYTEISTDAKKCPSCGYEPSDLGYFPLIGYIIAILISLTGAGIILGIGIVIGILAVEAKVSDAKPTNFPNKVDDEEEDQKTAWEKGEERGEKVNQTVRIIVSEIPSWIISVSIVLGIILSLSIWFTVPLESELAMSISLIGGSTLLFFSILIDVHRVNWADDELEFRWWFYSVLSFVPLIGWLFGLGWLARKRQKTGSAL